MNKPIFYDDLVKDIFNIKKKVTPSYRALSKNNIKKMTPILGIIKLSLAY